MLNSQAFDDALLAGIYDEDNPDGIDHDFIRELAVEKLTRNVVDLGCGTGILTVTLAGGDRKVVGIDPAEAMLDVARKRPQLAGIEWRHGTSNLIEPEFYDFAVMSGNVAMHILGEAWESTLSDLSRGLCPGGALVFESRNPVARMWEEWISEKTSRMTPMGILEEETQVIEPDEQGILTIKTKNFFREHNRRITVKMQLQFRSLELISHQLESHGFRIDHVYANWNKTIFENRVDQPLMIFVCTKV